MLYALIVIYSAFFSLLIATEYLERMKKYHLVFKTLTSMTFVLSAIYFFTRGNIHSAYFTFIIIALALCMCGDILLAMVPGKAGSMWFYIGVLMFLVSHISYYLGFVEIQAASLYDFIFPIVLAGLTYLLSRHENMNMDGMVPIVCVYTFFVGLLCSKGVLLFALEGATLKHTLLMIGAISFCASDIILLFVYFWKKKIGPLHFLNLFAYYLGTFLIAASVGL